MALLANKITTKQIDEGYQSLLQALVSRRTALEEILKKAESGIKKAPSGSLRIVDKKTYVQYYQITQKGDTQGKYIKKDNMKLAAALAKKDYDKKVVKTIEKEIKEIIKLEKAMNSIEEIYDSLPPRRRELVDPYVMSDKQYVEAWLSYKYEGKGFWNNDTEYYTGKGERVRSKSEIIIADMLDKKGIPYRYECPLF